MKIIAILNQKGGVGKTTLATNISHKFSADGMKTLLVDSDPQGSARDWHALGNSELACVGLDRPTLDRDLPKIAKEFEIVIIDGVPQLANMAVCAIKCADIIIIPIQPSPYDIWASNDLVDLIKQRQHITNGHPQAYFLVSMQINNTLLSKEIRDSLSGYDLPLLKSYTTRRTIYAKSAIKGQTVFDFSQESKEAANEITSIVNEIKGLL